MLCVRCKKRYAVVFITRLENDRTFNEGLCIQCAIELNIKPVNDIVDKMGITKDDIDNINTELMKSIESGEGPEEGEPGENVEGGAATLPFLQSLFGKGFDDQQSEKRGSGPAAPETEKKRGREKEKRKYLDSYCINITEKAKNGKLDRIIGREKEISRVMQILNRRTKNNPCLIGEPGVGKTAVAEGVAQQIASGMSPARLMDREVYLLDLTALVAGTQFRGQFESRIKGLVDEIRKLGNIILVIDEVHNLVSAGDAEGSMSAANILKPALSRGEIQVIGATTFAEYRKYIEKDAALERRFQPVVIEEPSVAVTTEILQGIKDYYERHHGVIIDDETVRQAVLLSERYITDRFLPDKAIDLIDEASSAANIENSALNTLERLKKELAVVRERQGELAPDGTPEVYQHIADLKAEECRLTEQIDGLQRQGVTVKISVDRLSEVIELWTGIPASKIREKEFSRLSHLEERLRSRIVGQDEAIAAVCAAIKRNRVGISPKKKPVSFIFTGPTGVGKTELVKTLAAELFDGVETMIRLDMSEFMEKHSVSRIIGAPPGYVGYDEAGQLTEKIRRRPYSVVLFDEIEKAHPDVMNILLQLLDDGKLTDAHGRTVNFENTIIIMTSNAGSDKKDGAVGFNRSVEAVSKEKAMKALSDFLRPEFLNRVDEVVAFRPLGEAEFGSIASIMLGDLKTAIAEKNIEFGWEPCVVEWLVKKSFSLKYGARNLRRCIQKEIEDRIANLLVENYEKQYRSMTVVCVNDAVEVRAE